MSHILSDFPSTPTSSALIVYLRKNLTPNILQYASKNLPFTVLITQLIGPNMGILAKYNMPSMPTPIQSPILFRLNAGNLLDMFTYFDITFQIVFDPKYIVSNDSSLIVFLF